MSPWRKNNSCPAGFRNRKGGGSGKGKRNQEAVIRQALFSGRPWVGLDMLWVWNRCQVVVRRGSPCTGRGFCCQTSRQRAKPQPGPGAVGPQSGWELGVSWDPVTPCTQGQQGRAPCWGQGCEGNRTASGGYRHHASGGRECSQIQSYRSPGIGDVNKIRWLLDQHLQSSLFATDIMKLLQFNTQLVTLCF